MFSTVRQLGLSRKQVNVVFNRDWMGFKKDHRTIVFENVADKLIKQGLVHLASDNKEIKIKKLVKVEVKEPEMKESESQQEQKEFKRPPKDKMVKKATVSK